MSRARDEEETGSKELVLAPGTYAYMQDVTKGTIRTFTGPTVINQTQQEVPVTYDPTNGTFARARNLEAAVRQSPVAVQGYYCVLFNPVDPEDPVKGQPQKGEGGRVDPDLQIGRRVVVPGPCMFPLWPGQAAHVIRGHQISRNEYLKVRVYDEQEARKHWGQAIIQRQVPVDGEEKETQEEVQSEAIVAVPEDLAVGRELVIKGEDVSFFIPHTGLTVVPEDKGDNLSSPQYVRQALTLERLEYCVLVDEDGNKRYERGPQVVFPEPTETFIRDEKGNRKFRAHELNKIQGIHIKVIEDYVEDDGTERKTGDEFFLTGETCQIYYPRKEHSLVRYDGKAKHFATAVPAGEGRYVMNRLTGAIETARGPAMLLPDPTQEVIVRRVLTPKQCELWYPGNQEVMEFNLALAEAMQQSPTTRAGVVSEGDAERHSRRRGKGGPARSALIASASMDMMERSVLGEAAGSGFQADEFSRQSTYTAPRMVTLDKTQFGVPIIQPYTSYAVMVTKKSGERRVVKGPATILLDYDETLEVLELSTGKPKTTDQLLRTVYLRTDNNKVADIVEVTTADNVRMRFKVSYVVNFVGDPNKWFAIENYIKFLCDHMRSLFKGQAKLVKIRALFEDPAKFIRDVTLGGKDEETGARQGRLFEDNGMRIDDVEVLASEIVDDRIRTLLERTAHQVVASNLEVETAQHELETARERAEITRANLTIEEQIDAAKAAQEQAKLRRELELALQKFSSKVDAAKAQLEAATESQAVITYEHDQDLARTAKSEEQRIAFATKDQELTITLLEAEAAAVVKRFEAVAGPFGETLATIGNQDALEKIARAASLQTALMGDKSVADALSQIFGETTLGQVFKRLSERSIPALNGGSNGAGARPVDPAE